MPVVPGVNDAPEQLAAMGQLLGSLGLRALKLLRYNALWEAKLPRLAGTPTPLGISARDDAYYEHIQASFASCGIV
jgi:pyruvate-formate lyase-activating enzyme